MLEIKHENHITYVGNGDGKWWRVDHAVNHRARLRRLNEWRDEQTLKRKWYRRHVVSRDMPNSKASRADYSDGGCFAKKLYAWLDGEFSKTSLDLPCVVAKRNCQKIARRLGLVHWWRVGYFVASVAKYGSKGRGRTMFDFNMSEATYYRRIELYAEILGFSQRC